MDASIWSVFRPPCQGVNIWALSIGTCILVSAAVPWCLHMVPAYDVLSLFMGGGSKLCHNAHNGQFFSTMKEGDRVTYFLCSESHGLCA